MGRSLKLADEYVRREPLTEVQLNSLIARRTKELEYRNKHGCKVFTCEECCHQTRCTAAYDLVNERPYCCVSGR